MWISQFHSYPTWEDQHVWHTDVTLLSHYQMSTHTQIAVANGQTKRLIPCLAGWWVGWWVTLAIKATSCKASVWFLLIRVRYLGVCLCESWYTKILLHYEELLELLVKGIPQGSRLDPILLNIFVNGLLLCYFIEKCDFITHSHDNTRTYSLHSLWSQG